MEKINHLKSLKMSLVFAIQQDIKVITLLYKCWRTYWMNRKQ